MKELIDEIRQQAETLEEAGKLANELRQKTLSKDIEYRFMQGNLSEPKVIKALKELRELQAKTEEARARYRELEKDYAQNIGEKKTLLEETQKKIIEYEKIDEQNLKKLEEELNKITKEQEKLEKRNAGPEK